MPHHRPLTLKRFFKAIKDPDLFTRYFKTLPFETPPSEWEAVNCDSFLRFLDDPRNHTVVIEEDFRRVNDLCGRGMNFIRDAHTTLERTELNECNTETLAMRLFVDYCGAFESAWARYLLYHSPSTLTAYHLPAQDRTVNPEHVEVLQADLAAWFRSLAKGDHCTVRHFAEPDAHTFLIARGSYLRTHAYWNDAEVSFTSFRPASEDVISYRPGSGLLTIKAALRKDREQYLKSFARCIVGNAQLAEAARNAPAYSLAPLQDGSFNFAGNGLVTGVDLAQIGFHLSTRRHEYCSIRSDDIRATLAERFAGVPLTDAEIVFAQFVFSLEPPDAPPAQVHFEIRPPSQTDLPQKRYADVIAAFLQEEGIIL